MILNKLVVMGSQYKRTILFKKHFNIIQGEATSGKSLILKLIDYCLGKSSKIEAKVQKELLYKCDQVFLEITIGNENLTLNRSLIDRFTKISIYFCPFEKIEEYTPKTVDIKDAMKIIMNKLQVNEVKLIRHQKHSTNKQIDTVSFRDLFRYVYINQHELGTNDFLGKSKPFKAVKNPYAFKMIFDLVDNDEESVKERLVDVVNQINKLKKETVGLESYLQDLDASDKIVQQSKLDEIYSEIESHIESKNRVIVSSEEKSNRNEENRMYIKLKKDISQLTNEISDYTDQKRHIRMAIDSKKILLNEYNSEMNDINETLNINYQINIDNQTIECPLCNSKINQNLHEDFNKEENSERILNRIKNQISNKIKLVNELIKDEYKNIEELDKKISILSTKHSIFDGAIRKFSRKVDVPYLSQIESLNSIINSLEREKETLTEGLRIHNKIEEKGNLISDLESEEERLKNKINQLSIDYGFKDDIFYYLNEHYRAYMRRLKYSVTEGTYIHIEKMIPFYEEASVYSHDSGGLLECMQISFLASILKSKSVGYASGHPGILMLDSISKYVGTLEGEDKLEDRIKDPEVYEEFYKILEELSENNQIILVENTPPSSYSRMYSQYTFYKGEKGLIDESFNEYVLNK